MDIEKILAYFLCSLVTGALALIAFVLLVLNRDEKIKFDMKGLTCIGEVLDCEKKWVKRRPRYGKGLPYEVAVYVLHVRCVHPFSGKTREFHLETTNKNAAKYLDCKSVELCFIPSRQRRKKPYLKEDMKALHADMILSATICGGLVLLSLGLFVGGIMQII